MTWTGSVLVIANRTATSDDLFEVLARRNVEGPTRFTLLVPGRRSDRAWSESQLAAAVKRLRDGGLRVDGYVGDPDPVRAVHAIWDPAKYDEIIVSTLPSASSRWLRIDLPRRVERITGAFVTHVVARETSGAPDEPVSTAAA